MDMAINSPIWKKTKAPWKEAPQPMQIAAE
jgi:nitrogenase molybdenum-iron protein alpha chain